MQAQLTQLLQSYPQIAQRQPKAIQLLSQVYRELFNEEITTGCGKCYQKAYYRIQKQLYLQQQKNTFTMNYPTRKYLLKPGQSLQTTFGGDILTNDNLTDEAAEKLLKAHPALITHFERYPDQNPPVKNEEVPAKQFKPDDLPVE